MYLSNGFANLDPNHPDRLVEVLRDLVEKVWCDWFSGLDVPTHSSPRIGKHAAILKERAIAAGCLKTGDTSLQLPLNSTLSTQDRDRGVVCYPDLEGGQP